MTGRVLIVDDEEAIVEGLPGLLHCEAIESSGAFDRLGAELLMEGTFYSVIVADLRLHTEGEGLELLELGMRKLLHSIPRKRYGLTADEAEEVVQQAWLLFLEKRDLIRVARPWLIGTVANLCKRRIGASMRRRETFVGDDALAKLPDTKIASCDDNIALRQALDSLNEESRTLCILIAIKGYAYDEVSAITGLPLGSIGPMYLRAKSKMRMAA